MSKFIVVFDLIPLLMLCVAWFFGSKPWGLAAFFLLCYWGIGGYFLATVGSTPDSTNMILSILSLAFLLTTGPMFAAIAGIQFGGVSGNPPAKIVHQSYSSLSPEQQEQVKRGAHIFAKLGLKYLADCFEEEGHKAEASALRKGSKLF